MNVIRLAEINQKLDPIINFDDDDDEKKGIVRPLAAGVGVGAGGYGAYKLHGAIKARQGAMNALVPGAKTGYAAAAGNLGKSTYQATKAAAPGALEGFLKKIKGILPQASKALSARHERLIQLNSLLAQRVEFQNIDDRPSPLAEFNRAHNRIIKSRVEALKAKMEVFRRAKEKRNEAREDLENAHFGDTPQHPALQRKLHRESYIRSGTTIGALTGTVAGTTAGALLGKRGGRIGPALVGGSVGATAGTLGGLQIGGRIRRKEKLPPGNYGIRDYGNGRNRI